MSSNRLIVFVFSVLILSCGSSKSVANSETQENNTVINNQIETDDNDIQSKVDEEATIEIPIDQEATSTTIENESPKNNDSIYFIKMVSHKNWDSLLKKHVSETGNVDYKGFKSDKVKLYAYIEKLQSNPPLDSWTRNQKLAYWINAYNAFTIDLIIRNYPLQSIKDIKNPWDQRLWKIGSKWYNLNDIEHQILRKMDEPRIHFAIVCASVSCPKLQNFAFDGWMLEEQLNKATNEFLTDSSKNIITANNLKLSKIFKWFAKDFKTKDYSLIDFLNQYSDVEISKTAKKSFLDYNWNLNE